MCARVIVIWLIPHQIALWVCSLIYSALQFNHNTLISKCNTAIIIMAISVDIIMDGGKCIVDNTLILPMHFYQRCWRKYPQNTNVQYYGGQWQTIYPQFTPSPPYHKYYKYNLNGLDTYFMNDVQPTFQNKN